MTLLDFQFVLGRRNIRPPHFASKVSYSASPQTFAECSHYGSVRLKAQHVHSRVPRSCAL